MHSHKQTTANSAVNTDSHPAFLPSGEGFYPLEKRLKILYFLLEEIHAPASLIDAVELLAQKYDAGFVSQVETKLDELEVVVINVLSTEAQGVTAKVREE